MRDAELWQRISTFQFDHVKQQYKFVDRLCNETDWRPHVARGAIEEYLRFIYLIATHGEMTPSKRVDKVWHLHLTHTHNYWNDFCAKTVGKQIHHYPTRGGEAEEAHFADTYERTLAAYREEFQMNPPENYWPRPNISKRSNGSKLQWIYNETSPERKLIGALVAGVTCIIVIASLSNGAKPLAGFAAFFGFIIIANILNPNGRRDGGSCGSGGGDGGGHGGCSGGGCSGSCGGGGCGGH